MYRKKLYDQMKRNGKAIKIIGFVLVIPFGILLLGWIFMVSVYLLHGGSFSYELICIGGALLLAMVTGLVSYSIGKNYVDPKKSIILKRHPEILDLIDEFDQGVIYEDNNIVISENAIASTLHLQTIVRRDEVKECRVGMKSFGRYRCYVGVSLRIKTDHRTVFFLVEDGPKGARTIRKYCNNVKITYMQ